MTTNGALQWARAPIGNDARLADTLAQPSGHLAAAPADPAAGHKRRTRGGRPPLVPRLFTRLWRQLPDYRFSEPFNCRDEPEVARDGRPKIHLGPTGRGPASASGGNRVLRRRVPRTARHQ